LGLNNTEKALKHYTDAIRYSLGHRKGALDLSTAYENRSVVYFHLGQWEHALADIEDAILTNQLVGFRIQSSGSYRNGIELELRACECLIQLGRPQEAKARFDLI